MEWSDLFLGEPGASGEFMSVRVDRTGDGALNFAPSPFPVPFDDPVRAWVAAAVELVLGGAAGPPLVPAAGRTSGGGRLASLGNWLCIPGLFRDLSATDDDEACGESVRESFSSAEW